MLKNNKIAIVVNDSWAAYNFRLNLGRALKEAGYEIVYICPRNEYSKLIEKEFQFIDVKLDTKGTNPIEDICTIYRFYKLYKEIQPSVILHYSIKPNIYGTIAAGILNIDSINNIAGLGTLFIKTNIVTKIAKYLYKFSQKRASKVFFQNKDDFKIFVDEKLVDKSKCAILPGSGVDINKFKPIPKKPNNKFVFLLVARMLWSKGISEYVEAAKIIQKSHNNVEFQLLGQIGVLSPTAIPKTQIEEWDASGVINYIGTSDNVQIEIGQSDCVVLPSFYREGTPRVLLESASMEKPIITTNNVGCKDVVDDGSNGYICKIKDPIDLAKKMKLMIELTENERNIMGKNGRIKIINQYDEKIVIKNYLDSIENLNQEIIK